jgi:hypothetical protein
MRWAGHDAHMGGDEKSIEGLGENPESKSLLRIPMINWEDIINMDFQEIGLERAWSGFIWLRIGTSCGLL